MVNEKIIKRKRFVRENGGNRHILQTLSKHRGKLDKPNGKNNGNGRYICNEEQRG